MTTLDADHSVGPSYGTGPGCFYFDGRPLPFRQGDTVASALLRNGVSVVGRGFKFHRPRGVMSAGIEEPNALVSVERGGVREPNLRATLVSVHREMRVFSQNRWPALRADLGASFNLLRRFLPASFYYKTFFWPGWGFWEPLVRHIAGLGRAPDMAGSWRYRQRSIEVHTLIIGCGASGIRAARAALAAGEVPICLVDLRSCEECLARHPGLAELLSEKNIELLERTTAIARYDDGSVVAVSEDAMGGGAPCETRIMVRPRELVLAAGALERPMVFPFNDRPGIMLAASIVHYAVRRGVPFPGGLVLYGNNDSLWRSAAELLKAGIGLRAVIDIRDKVDDTLLQPVFAAQCDVHLGCRVVHTRGWMRLSSVTLQPVEHSHCTSGQSGASLRIACRWLGVCGGWTPSVHLYSQLGGKLRYDEDCAACIPAVSLPGVTVTGAAAGEFPQPLKTQPLWCTPGVSSADQWVDHQYDVTAADIGLAVRESFRSVEHVKRFTTSGMSLDQGKTSNANALGLLADELRSPVDNVGTTRYRPPFQPVSLGVLAGEFTEELYAPRRLLPAHAVHKRLGACFAEHGSWLRPDYYLRPGEDEAATIAREAKVVRSRVGILDYSSLGKIEVLGADAREFLNRVYVNNLAKLKPGAARYGVMLREDGIVLDDGIVVCRAEDSFLVHTSSAGAPTVYAHLDEWLQCEWRDLQVSLCNVTTSWATIMIAGPDARALVGRLLPDIDLSPALFPHMQWCEWQTREFPLRILRASYTGEAGYEISVPAPYGASFLEAVLHEGRDLCVEPFGVETLMLLRAEKGYLHLGVDTDGTTMPQDIGWGAAIERKPGDFIGRRSLRSETGSSTARLRYTGLLPLGSVALRAGAHVVAESSRRTTGYVTSAYFSPTLNAPIALGLVENADERRGEVVTVFDEGRRSRARICDPCFFDPGGEKLRA